MALLIERLGIDESSHVLDVGCGTGNLTVPLARQAGGVVGVDPDPEMLKEAFRVALDLGLGSIRWVRALGEALPFASGMFDAVTLASAFHWMERERALEQVWGVLRFRGAVAVVSSGTALREVMERRGVGAAVAEVQDRWFDPARRAASGVFGHPKEPHVVVIARSRFGLPERLTVPWKQDWDVDRMIGLLYSTSLGVRRLLGDRVGEFEGEIREAILQAEPTGLWTTDEEIELLICTKVDA